MIGAIARKIFGTRNERELKRLRRIVEEIHAHEEEMRKIPLSDVPRYTQELREQVRERLEERKEELGNLRERIAQALTTQEKLRLKRILRELKNEILNPFLPPAFALVKETARKLLGKKWSVCDIEMEWDMVHFDVQLMGGIVIHEGKIAEMATGEGKTLVATLPAFLNSLTGEGVHIVTVNDYLARRDREWMGPLYESLGLTVGVIQSNMGFEERRQAYACDITYGTNNEFGFDYLRDNMATHPQQIVQRKLNFAIIDEVDSVLIDEARTPLIISGPSEESTDIYYRVDKVARQLKEGEDYEVDEKSKSVILTERGIARAEKLLGVDTLYDTRFMDLAHCLVQALRAHRCFQREVDYIVKDGKVIIVDEFTGRLLPGRRFSEGLHQALEAKERVKIEEENQTLATITFQNYFRLYEKISGMTGTAKEEAEEFYRIYDLEVVIIPTNKPLRREEYPDVIYKTREEMLDAVIREIKEMHEQGRPVLVGTLSIEMSETISNRLRREGIKHEVLNAKHHEREARIIAKAGERGAVTIATQMAGRGTDIKLGEGVAELGGLHILGVERHEARRIDNQLRGRAGRQGDPGSSRFYLSLEDDLLRIFGGDRLKRLMERMGLPDGEPITHPWISKAIENAQKRVEAYHFDIRKTLLEFDEVMDRQREVIYAQRRKILEGKDVRGEIEDILEEVIGKKVEFYTLSGHPEEWDWEGLRKWVRATFGFNLKEFDLNTVTRDELKMWILEKAKDSLKEKEKLMGEEAMQELTRVVLLHTIDRYWKDHLRSMDELREGIGLRAYGQRDPLVEYKNEAFALFQSMIERIREEVVEFLFRMEWSPVEMKFPTHAVFEHPGEWMPLPRAVPQEEPVMVPSHREEKLTPYRRERPKIGRNDPCPCGSGKKYKKCCGKNV